LFQNWQVRSRLWILVTGRLLVFGWKASEPVQMVNRRIPGHILPFSHSAKRPFSFLGMRLGREVHPEIIKVGTHVAFSGPFWNGSKQNSFIPSPCFLLLQSKPRLCVHGLSIALRFAIFLHALREGCSSIALRFAIFLHALRERPRIFSLFKSLETTAYPQNAHSN
jgi:hypothetical protein